MQFEALSQMTVKQLAEVASTPGLLTSAEQANMVMNYVPDQLLPDFFDDFSPVIMVSIHQKSHRVFC